MSRREDVIRLWPEYRERMKRGALIALAKHLNVSKQRVSQIIRSEGLKLPTKWSENGKSAYKMNQEGLRWEEIGRQLDIPTDGARAVARRYAGDHGLTLKNQPNKNTLRILEVIELRKKGWGWQEIADELGYSGYRTAWNAVYDYKGKIRKNP